MPSFQVRRPSSDGKASGPSAPTQGPANDDLQSTMGNAAVGDLLPDQADRLTRLNDRDLRPGDFEDRWSGRRERDREDFLNDTHVDPAVLPKDPESVLAAKEPDWGLFIQACSNVSQARRQVAIQYVRGQQRWDDMLAHLGPEHMRDLQGWLEEDLGDDTEKKTEERVETSLNADRAKSALAVVDAAAAKDPEGRITPRLRELLSLGVGMPANERDPLGSEGILSVSSVERAVQALLKMPLQEYFRLLVLLELGGDKSRMKQSFLLLEATAARLGEFDKDGGNLEELEGFSDAIRGLDDRAVVDQTSVTQVDKNDRSAMVSKFTTSDGAAAAQVVKAEADPLLALRMNQGGELGRDALNTKAAAEQEGAVERHGRQTAIPRRSSEIRDAVLKVLRNTACSPAERAAVQGYLTGGAYDEKLFQSAVPKIRRGMGLSFPGEQAMRLAREAAVGGSRRGLSADNVADEMNGGIGASGPTGEKYEADVDQALVEDYEAENREFNEENLAKWGPHVQRILNKAAPGIEKGQDIVIEVKLEHGGHQFMTFTNVDAKGGRFLVMNTANGKSAWLDSADMVKGDWSKVGGGRGILTTLVG